MTSRIEQIISEIEEYIDGCKFQPLSNSKIIVNKEELDELLTELRMKTPDEIKRYQKILRQREEILDDAEQKAAAILSDAQEQYKALVEEHAIMQEAYQQAEITVREANEQADQIIANARAQAAEIGNGAIYYTKDLLEMSEKTLAAALESTSSNARALEAAMQGYLDVIRQNKAELVTEDPDDRDAGQEAAAQQEIIEEPAEE